jgi:zinc and cadmium transporter
VAVADLLPQLQRPLPLRDTAAQIALIALGLGLITAVGGFAHGH